MTVNDYYEPIRLLKLQCLSLMESLWSFSGVCRLCFCSAAIFVQSGA